MKITKKHNDGLTAFQELELGDIFLYHNTYYIKTECHILSKGGTIDAVNIQTGNLAYFRTEEVKKSRGRINRGGLTSTLFRRLTSKSPADSVLTFRAGYGIIILQSGREAEID